MLLFISSIQLGKSNIFGVMIFAASDSVLAVCSYGHITGFSCNELVCMALILKKVYHSWHRRTLKLQKFLHLDGRC
jgi:hypothetical protein